MTMHQIHTSGTPYEIGLAHGEQGRQQVRGSIAFYTALFKDRSGLDWAQATQKAREFDPFIQEVWPEILDEIHGISL